MKIHLSYAAKRTRKIEAQKKKTGNCIHNIDFSYAVVVDISNEQKPSGECNALKQICFDDSMFQLTIFSSSYRSWPKLTPPSTRLSPKLYQVLWKQREQCQSSQVGCKRERQREKKLCLLECADIAIILSIESINP
jgi:hypothetical protein